MVVAESHLGGSTADDIVGTYCGEDEGTIEFNGSSVESSDHAFDFCERDASLDCVVGSCDGSIEFCNGIVGEVTGFGSCLSLGAESLGFSHGVHDADGIRNACEHFVVGSSQCIVGVLSGSAGFEFSSSLCHQTLKPSAEVSIYQLIVGSGVGLEVEFSQVPERIVFVVGSCL